MTGKDMRLGRDIGYAGLARTMLLAMLVCLTPDHGVAQDRTGPSAAASEHMQRPPEGMFWTKQDGYSVSVVRPMTPAALALARRAVLVWDSLESGAPRLHPLTPFGKPDAGSDIATAFGASDQITTADALMRFTTQLMDFFERGALQPGTYALRNVPVETLRKQMAWLNADDAALGLTADGKVLVTPDHITLLRRMVWEWPNEYDVEGAVDHGVWPMPVVDPKRPYGAMTYFQLDIHEALGWPVLKKNDDGYIALTDEQDEKAVRLHFQMLAVAQVFLENAVVPQ